MRGLNGVGGDRGRGGLAVSGRAGFRGPGRLNGPPSRRLAPGGFYASTRTEDGPAPKPAGGF